MLKARTFALATSLLTLSLTVASQSVSFERRTYPDIAGSSSDFNNDGREDFLRGSPAEGARVFQVVLSSGDGIYGAPQSTPVPERDPGSWATGDYNSDGNADVIVSNGTSRFYQYFGNGDGTFRSPVTHTFSTAIVALLAGEMNQDRRNDLLILFSGTSTSTLDFQVYFGRSDGGFTPGPITLNIEWGSHTSIGDFDGDGRTDVFSETYDGFSGAHDEVLFGDGAGNFPVRVRPDHDGQYAEPRDVNGDGRMDLLAVPFTFSTHGSLYYPKIIVLYGTSARTFNRQDITFSRCLQDYPLPLVNDFNGDGVPDLAFVERSNCDEDLGPATTYLVLATGRGDGTFNPEQTLQEDTNGVLTVLRANRDTKADFVSYRYVAGGCCDAEYDLWLNTTSGNFPRCQAPNSYTGINVCSPPSSTTSPVRFSIGASGQTLMRKVEVWVDGQKKTETLRRHFSNYGFLDADIALANGTHNVDIYSAGWDNLLQKRSFSFTVGSGGGTTCTAPSATTVAICEPANGSTVASPVKTVAQGGSSVTFMEVWVDGAKKFQNAGNKVDTAIVLAGGSHTMTVVGKVGSTVTSKPSVTFAVGSGGGTTCSAPTSPGVNVCSPANGSTVSSPVRGLAKATVSGTLKRFELWVDGVKNTTVFTNTIDKSVALSAGAHRFSFIAVNTADDQWKTTVNFTVQ